MTDSIHRCFYCGNPTTAWRPMRCSTCETNQLLEAQHKKNSERIRVTAENQANLNRSIEQLLCSISRSESSIKDENHTRTHARNNQPREVYVRTEEQKAAARAYWSARIKEREEDAKLNKIAAITLAIIGPIGLYGLFRIWMEPDAALMSLIILAFVVWRMIIS